MPEWASAGIITAFYYNRFGFTSKMAYLHGYNIEILVTIMDIKSKIHT